MIEKNLGLQIQDAIQKQEILRLSLKEVCDSHGQIINEGYKEEAMTVRSTMYTNRKTIKTLVSENEWNKKEYRKQTSREKGWW